MQGFIKRSGEQLHLHGSPYYFSGANSYYLLTRSADLATRPEVTQVLDCARRCGITVLRSWAFNDGPDQWNALQPQLGQLDEKVLCGLDWLVTQCKERGLRLMLALINYWPEFGGMPQYVRWCEPAAVCPGDVPKAEAFYGSSGCQAAYKQYVGALVTRVNTVSGVPYKDEPAIFGWELCNEPRCEGDKSGNIIKDWVSRAAAHLRGLDPNHLIGIGTEGFFGMSTPDLLQYNPYPGAESHGVDFVAQQSDENIDFVSFHGYPDHWGHACPHALHPGGQPGSSQSMAPGSMAEPAAAPVPAALPAGSCQAAGTGVGAATAVSPSAAAGSCQAAGAGAGAATPVSPCAAAGSGAAEGTGSGPAAGADASAGAVLPPCCCAGSKSAPFLRSWIDVHVEACRQHLHKPLILSEYGVYRCTSCSEAGLKPGRPVACPTDDGPCRSACFDLVLGEVAASASSGGPLAGAAFWMIAANPYPDYDGFTLYLSGALNGPEGPPLPADEGGAGASPAAGGARRRMLTVGAALDRSLVLHCIQHHSLRLQNLHTS